MTPELALAITAPLIEQNVERIYGRARKGAQQVIDGDRSRDPHGFSIALDRDSITGSQTETVTDGLGDDDLSFWSKLASHTDSITALGS